MTHAAAAAIAFVTSFLASGPASRQSVPACSPNSTGGLVVLNAIEGIPTQWWFFPAIVLTAVAYSVSCWWRHQRLSKGLRSADDSGSTVVRELRLRALFSRIRAEIFLGGVVASLFGGLYATIYVSQYLASKDKLAANAALYEEFRSRIDALTKGEYWLRTETLADGPSGTPFLSAKEKGGFTLQVGSDEPSSTFESADGGVSWSKSESKEPNEEQYRPSWELVALEVDEYGQFSELPNIDRLDEPAPITAIDFYGARHGLIGTQDKTYVTTNGGQEWEQWERAAFGLDSLEWVVGAVLDNQGPRIVVGDEGTVWTRAGSGAMPMKLPGLVTTMQFRADGRHGFIATSRATYETTDSGKTWEQGDRSIFGLNPPVEWIASAVLDDQGPRIVVGDEGSVRIRTDSGWSSAELEQQDPLLALEFSADGQRGLIATRFAANITMDGGKTWEPKVLGLNANESLAGAVVSQAGPLLVVGDQGTVHMPTIDLSKQAIPPDYVARNGARGLVLLNSLRRVDLEVPVTRWARTANDEIWIKNGEAAWEQARTNFLRDETIAATTSGEDEGPIVVGNKGSVYMHGETKSLGGDFPSDKGEYDGNFAVASLDGTLAMAVTYDDRVAIYTRTKHSLDNVDALRTLTQELADESDLRRRVESFQDRRSSKPSLLEILGIDQTFWMRVVAMAATIYFVQLLVRLYQYSIRLAAFLDARADAILLNSDIGDPNTNPPFKDLVTAMSLESVDFGPPKFSSPTSSKAPANLDA